MRDPFQSNRRRRRAPRLIEVDAWIDTSVYRAGRAVASAFETLSVFMRRFRVTGLARAAVEVGSDGLTLGCAGLLLMLALALPAFDATRTDWRTQGDYSLTILDRYGNEIGKRGIRQSDAVPLEEYPDHLIKAVLATEDRRFFTNRRIWGG
jgi:penicillin-binding protein 1A